MSTSYWRVDELAHELARVASEVETHQQAGNALKLPALLVRAARRIVAASDQSRAQAALETMPVSQAVVYLIEHQEVVTATDLQTRLAEIGREVRLASVTVALHRARRRGLLVSPARGSFSRPGTSDGPHQKGGGPRDG